MTRLSLDLLIFESGGALAGLVETHGACDGREKLSVRVAGTSAGSDVGACEHGGERAGRLGGAACARHAARRVHARADYAGPAAERLRGAPSIGAVLDHQALRLPCAAFCARA